MLATLAGSISTSVKEYVDDVFSVDTWTGTAGALRVNNGVDLANKGGMVFTRGRTGAVGGRIFDSINGTSNCLNPASTAALASSGTSGPTFEAGGFTLGADSIGVNNASTSSKYMDWTFREAKKFFDIVKYTNASNVGAQDQPHNLAGEIGMIWIKRTDAVTNWGVWHRGTGANDAITAASLNLTTAPTTVNGSSSTHSSSTFNTGGIVGAASAVFTNTGEYTAYIFGHDTSADGKIICDTFTTNSGGTAVVSLAWGEPQAIMLRLATGAGNWTLHDDTRGAPFNTASQQVIIQSTAVESSTVTVNMTPTGFTLAGLSASTKYMFMAIRRPNKPPSSGLDVFMPQVRTGTGASALINTDPNFSSTPSAKTWSPDALMARRTNSTTDGAIRLWTRKMGNNIVLPTNATTSSATLANSVQFDDFRGVRAVSAAPNTAFPFMIHSFKRAPKFLDIVTWTGDDTTNRLIPHGLGGQPALVLVRRLNSAGNWRVYVPAWSAVVTGQGILNVAGGYDSATDLFYADDSDILLETGGADTNAGGSTYQAMVFGRLPGIAMDGYMFPATIGQPQTVDCGFTTGARFVLLHNIMNEADGVGNDWMIFDTAMGIVLDSTEQFMAYNSNAVPAAAAQWIDPHPSGFTVRHPTLVDGERIIGYFAIA